MARRKIGECAKLLRSCREGKDWMQSHLSRLVGMSSTYVCHVETGRQNFNLTMAIRFANAFDMAPDAWIEASVNDWLAARGLDLKVEVLSRDGGPMAQGKSLTKSSGHNDD